MSVDSFWLSKPDYSFSEAAYLLADATPDQYTCSNCIDNWPPKAQSLQKQLWRAFRTGELKAHRDKDDDRGDYYIEHDDLVAYAQNLPFPNCFKDTTETLTARVPNAAYPTVYGLIATLWKLKYGEVNAKTIVAYLDDCKKNNLIPPSEDDKNRTIHSALIKAREYLRKTS